MLISPREKCRVRRALVFAICIPSRHYFGQVVPTSPALVTARRFQGHYDAEEEPRWPRQASAGFSAEKEATILQTRPPRRAGSNSRQAQTKEKYVTPSPFLSRDDMLSMPFALMRYVAMPRASAGLEIGSRR